MPLLVGLNGFGRIGRIVLRTCFLKPDIEIVAINDPVIDIEYICYLIKFDSTHGKLVEKISYSDNEVTINDKKIKVFHERLPSSIPWYTLGVEYVVEASGMFSNMDTAAVRFFHTQGHLISSRVKCVLVTTPGVDIPMLILGVNEHMIKKDQRVISCASSTTYCLAPLVKVLEDKFGVSEGFVTSIHAITPSLKPLDGLCLKGKHWRDHRSIHQNVIPAATSACKVLGKIIPSVNDKLTGLTFRVPIVNVSVLDITVRLNKSTSIREIAAQIEKEGTGKMKNIITTSYEEAVSSDFMNDEHSCILDVNASLELTPTFFKLVCWYENEYSYACRVIDTIFFLQERIKSQKLIESCVSFKLNSDTTSAFMNQDVIKKYKGKKLYTSMPLGYSHNDTLNKEILNESTFPVSVSYTNPEDNTNENQEQIIIQICDDTEKNSNMTREINASCNVNEKRGRRKHTKKELAKIPSKTEDFLKESHRDMIKKFQPSGSNGETKFTDQNKIKTLVKVNNEGCNIESVLNVNHIDSLFNILNEIKTHNVEGAFIDIEKQIDAKYENIPEDSIREEENHIYNEIKTKNCNIFLNNFESKEKTTVPIIRNRDIKLSNNKDINRTDHNREHLNNDIYYESNICDKQDILPLKFINNENHSAPLDSKKIELVPNDTILKLKVSQNTDIKHEMLKKNILPSVLKTSHDDKMNMFNSFKFMNNTERNIAKENLLDKLASETDSDYSFQMDDTKSEIIDITEVSSSTDDLARLDKLCRIIEMSDELSDKLFSSLKINPESGKKVWTFKEFCEKIKLDDFCHTLF